MKQIAGLAATVCWLFMSAGVGLGEDQFPDDHGDDATQATPVSPGGVATAGEIDMYVDRDYFSFTAQAGKQYVVTVVEETVPDVTIRLRSQGESGNILAVSHSVGASEGVLQWANTVGAYPVYIEVTSFAMFATGSYTIQVEEQNLTDSEPDGLPDAWEYQYFGNLDQGPDGDYDLDGVSNYEEYLLGSDPTRGQASELIITALNGVGGSRTITFTCFPLRRYEIQATSGIGDLGWSALGAVTSETSVATFDDVNASEHCLYRVQAVP